MPGKEFRTRLVRPPGVGTWTFAMVLVEVARAEGFRHQGRVKGTIEGRPYRSSLMSRGGGKLFVVVNQEMREAIGKRPGDLVELRLVRDLAPPVIELPAALARALRTDPTARGAFDRLAPSHRKAYAHWVASAKRDETVERRVGQALQMIRQGKTLQ
jgi:hypothetical protein